MSVKGDNNVLPFMDTWRENTNISTLRYSHNTDYKFQAAMNFSFGGLELNTSNSDLKRALDGESCHQRDRWDSVSGNRKMLFTKFHVGKSHTRTRKYVG